MGVNYITERIYIQYIDSYTPTKYNICMGILLESIICNGKLITYLPTFSKLSTVYLKYYRDEDSRD
jgi:hypothetical protein